MPTETAPERGPTKLERAGSLAARISSLEPADPNLRRGLHAGVGILVVLGIALAVVAALGDFPDVDWRFRPVAIAPSVIGLSLFLLLNAVLSPRLLRALGPARPPVRSLALWSTPGLGRYVPTSLLLPMLRVAMCNRDDIPGRITMASIVYEFSLFLAANLAVGAYFVITLPDLEGDWQRW